MRAASFLLDLLRDSRQVGVADPQVPGLGDGGDDRPDAAGVVRSAGRRVVVGRVHERLDGHADRTGGPDHTRGIWPVVATVTESGYLRVSDADLAAVAETVEQERRRTHEGRGGAR